MLQKSNVLHYEAWYPVDMKRRYREGGGEHKLLYAMFLEKVPEMTRNLHIINGYADVFSRIPAEKVDETSPFWLNGFLALLDGMSLYAFVAERRPKVYCEIGSGNSTKFVRQAVGEHSPLTGIVSIDPCPRAEIDGLADSIYRTELENMDLGLFAELEAGDIVFFDGSHRIFQNSDCVVFYLEVLPVLKPGVIIAIHDIFLPYDYCHADKRFYNEQYLLAASLLFSERFEVLLPGYYASCLPPMCEIMNRRNPAPHLCRVDGSIFWMKKL